MKAKVDGRMLVQGRDLLHSVFAVVVSIDPEAGRCHRGLVVKEISPVEKLAFAGEKRRRWVKVRLSCLVLVSGKRERPHDPSPRLSPTANSTVMPGGMFLENVRTVEWWQETVGKLAAGNRAAFQQTGRQCRCWLWSMKTVV